MVTVNGVGAGTGSVPWNFVGDVVVGTVVGAEFGLLSVVWMTYGTQVIAHCRNLDMGFIDIAVSSP